MNLRNIAMKLTSIRFWFRAMEAWSANDLDRAAQQISEARRRAGMLIVDYEILRVSIAAAKNDTVELSAATLDAISAIKSSKKLPDNTKNYLMAVVHERNFKDSVDLKNAIPRSIAINYDDIDLSAIGTSMLGKHPLMSHPNWFVATRRIRRWTGIYFKK